MDGHRLADLRHRRPMADVPERLDGKGSNLHCASLARRRTAAMTLLNYSKEYLSNRMKR